MVEFKKMAGYNYRRILWGLIIIVILIFIVIQYSIPAKKIARLEKLTTIPTFTELEIAYEHIYKNKNTSPAISGAIFDIEGDGVKEIFVTGGMVRTI